MLNIEKEREAFEALPQIKEILRGEDVYFSTLSMNYTSKKTELEHCVYYINGAWYSWQEQDKKLEGCVAPVWVATDFLLPDEGELVLFLDKNDVIHEGSLNTDYVDGPYGENGEDFGDNQTLWTSNSNGEELLPSKVKFWMTRPTSPVEAARGGK
ncbi:hypothetical protein SB581_12235 [Acinetobacter baumannii]|nr:hypothetical protein SB581_12235 [Acinetobacter baumannii]